MNILINSGLDGGALRWWLVADTGVVVRQGDERDLAEAGGGRRLRTLWLMHGEQTGLTRAGIPVKGHRALRQAVPYAIEDDVACDVEGLAFAYRQGKDGVDICYAERSTLLAGGARLGRLGIFPQRVLPDVLALPWTPGGWSLLLDGERVLLRHGAALGMAMERENAAWLLRQLRSQGPEQDGPMPVHVWGGYEPPEIEGVDWIAEAGDAAACFAQGLQGLPPGLDYAGQLRDAQGPGAGDMRRLGVAAGVACLAFAMAYASQFIQVQRLEHYNRQLHGEMVSLYREAFPDARRIVKPGLQMRQRLQALEKAQASPQGVLARVADTAPLIAAEPGYSVERVEYRGGELRYGLHLPDLAGLDRLRSRLERQGDALADIGGVEKLDKGVRAVIRLGERR